MRTCAGGDKKAKAEFCKGDKGDDCKCRKRGCRGTRLDNAQPRERPGRRDAGRAMLDACASGVTAAGYL